MQGRATGSSREIARVAICRRKHVTVERYNKYAVDAQADALIIQMCTIVCIHICKNIIHIFTC